MRTPREAGEPRRLELAARGLRVLESARVPRAAAPHARRFEAPAIATAPFDSSRRRLRVAGRIASDASERRSYAFLIERLLPVRGLDPSLAVALRSALASGDPEALHRSSLAALRERSAAGEFEEQPALRPGEHRFEHRSSGERVVLEAP